ncbi:ABC transporter substrate-binding protein [Plastorhodobacter daqingensis]|uniref:ABC transporter substrate-binding protein n=1 Tax=Plastorhodobacter daqingensis TaxID=1387281 RepID=A0ABW2UQ81_9RHOB
MTRTKLVATTALTLFATSASAQDTITFTSFGGAFQEAQRKALLDPAAEALNITILEDTLTGIAEVRAQVLAGAVTWDIVDLGLADCAAAQAEGILEPLDYSQISVEGFEEAAYSDAWAGIIYFSTVLAFDTDLFGDNPPQSWADFWDVENFPGARSLRNNPVGTLEIALLADGVPVDEIYPLDLDRAFAKMAEIQPHIDVWWTSGAQSAQLIADGEVDMIAIWNGRLDAVVADGIAADYTYNQGIAQLDCLAIPRGAPNKDVAMQALAIMLAPEQQAQMPQYINYGPTTSLAFDLGIITDEQTAISPSAPENLANQLIMNADYWAENRQAVQERWDAFITQ